MLIEQDSFLGGILKNSNKVNSINGISPSEWIKETEHLLINSKNITVLKNTLVTTYNFTNHLVALEDKFSGRKIDLKKSELTLHKIRTSLTILSNGHIERFISFRNNDLPGVMLASSFEKYIHRYGVIPEKKPIIFSNNSSTLSLLKSMISLGYKPEAYIDSRKKDEVETETKKFLKSNNINYYFDAEVEGCDGNKKLKKLL